ncbi:hypothetical protein BU15DRAFT_82948 [Melanogaster broomeanus]|nr:hypothetical protein BU15DRAFT_82948 [Melanogaster broomeanus]
MSTLTKTAAADTSSAIWEFDPMLPDNRVLGGSLDAVATVRTLTVKIQASDQHIAYFECLQVECSIEKPLGIPLHSNIQWGTADSMLERSYQLRQPVNLFISSANELFGPVTSHRRPGQPTKHLPWTAFTMTPSDWERVNDVYLIISDANSIQHIFSHDHLATLWHAIPAFEVLIE